MQGLISNIYSEAGDLQAIAIGKLVAFGSQYDFELEASTKRHK